MFTVCYLRCLHELLSLIPVAVGVLWSWYQWKNRRLIHIAKQLPTIEPTVPILGHLYFALLHSFRDIVSYFVINVMEKAASKNIKQFCLWMGPIPYIFIMDPKDVKIYIVVRLDQTDYCSQTDYNIKLKTYRVVLSSSKSLERGKEYDLFKFALGNGLLTSKVQIWKHSRKHIQPLFHPRRLEHILPSLNEKAKLFVARLPDEICMKKMEFFDKFIMYAVSSVLDLLHGPDIVERNLGSDPESQWIREATEGIVLALHIWSDRMFKIWTHWNLLFQVLYKNSLSKIKNLSDKTEPGIKIVRENMFILKDKTLNNGSENVEQLTLPKIFAHLILSNSKFNEKSYHDEVITFVGAGADTTSIIMSSCLLSLASHSDIQEQVFQEILEVCGITDDDISMQELRKLTFLDRVLKETNRRFAVVPLITRETSEDLKLSFGTIPAGSFLYIATYGIHMNRSTYPDPYRFDPDRFLPENGLKRDKHCYIPFSSGPRNCIGKDYAMMEMKIFIVYILRKYKISLSEDVTNMDLKYQSTMIRKDGYPIHFIRRRKKDLTLNCDVKFN